MRVVVLLWAVFGMAWAQDTSDLERGKRLFRGNCAGCHGIDGSGGSGPSLSRSKFKRAPDDAALVELIINGIPAAGMPSSWHLLPDGPKHLAAYVNSFRQVNEPPVPGNVPHGRAVYRTAGCGGCHIIHGDGRGLGPELTDIGARRTAEALRKAIVNPGESIPESFLLVRAQLRDGRQVRGIRLNEDSFTIQLKDSAGAFHSFRKAELVKLDKQPGQSLMPAYDRLSAADLQDLVAYLVSLRGEE
jgi:cytochrome c oxidase cbb3-type subunit III